MSFNRANLAGRAELNPEFNNSHDDKVGFAEFMAHTDNGGIHVSLEDRKRWDETLQKAKDYVDYRFRSIIGKFDFGEIGIDNSLTLAEIILASNKARLADVQAEKGERLAAIQKEKTDREEAIKAEMLARVSEDRVLKNNIDDVDAKVEKEIADRTEQVGNEIRIRQTTDEDIIAKNAKQDEDLKAEGIRLEGLINEERNDRIKDFETTYQRVVETLDDYQTQINDFRTDANVFKAEVQGIITANQNNMDIVRQALNQEIEDRIRAINEEATTRQNQITNILNKLA